jgi:hypothetical protein
MIARTSLLMAPVILLMFHYFPSATGLSMGGFDMLHIVQDIVRLEVNIGTVLPIAPLLGSWPA